MRIMINNKKSDKLQTISTTKHTNAELYHDPNSNEFKPTGRMFLRVDQSPDVILHPLTHDRYVTIPTKNKITQGESK